MLPSRAAARLASVGAVHLRADHRTHSPGTSVALVRACPPAVPPAYETVDEAVGPHIVPIVSARVTDSLRAEGALPPQHGSGGELQGDEEAAGAQVSGSAMNDSDSGEDAPPGAQ